MDLPRIEQLERKLDANLTQMYENQRQIKVGLDAAEINQRAIIKALEDIALHIAPEVLQGSSMKLDWSMYFKLAAEEKQMELKNELLLKLKEQKMKGEAVEPRIDELQASVTEELAKANASASRIKEAARFFATLKFTIQTVKDLYAKLEADPNAEVDTNFNESIIDVAVDMLASLEKQKSSLVEQVPAVEDSNTITREFGG